MRAVCERSHRRVDMEYQHQPDAFVCPTCRAVLTPAAIWDAAPAYMRPSDHPIGRALQSMADYRVIGVVRPTVISVEYERPSHDGKT